MRHEFLFIALAICLSGCGGDQSGQIGDGVSGSRHAEPWSEEFYNFAPSEGDLIVKGPCGSRFTFRPVTTFTVENWLANETVLLGQADPASNNAQRALIEGVRSASVVGAFAEDGDPSTRQYFIGKYEVTQDQYDAVLGDGCPEPTPEGATPVSEVSFFDTQRFLVALNEWIYSSPQRTEALPHADQIPAIVRLPSEAEWEFAARGGQAVLAEERLLSIYPMEDTENRYEWYAGDDSCRDSIRPIGYLIPNPLGLHDMLGNVREIVQDPFQLTAGRQYQGQTGAMLTKGGACDTPVEDLRSSARREYLLYDYETGELNRPDFVGFRLALGAPAVPSSTRLEAYEEAFSKLRLPRAARLVDGSDPATELRALADNLTDADTMETLERIAAAIDAEMVDRNTFEMESAKALVATSSSLIRNYRFAARDAAASGDQLNNPNIPESNRALFEERFRSSSLTRDISRDFYARLLIRGAEFDAYLFQSAARYAARENERLDDDRVTGLSPSQMMCLYAAQVDDYRRRRRSGLEPYFQQLQDAQPENAPACPTID